MKYVSFRPCNLCNRKFSASNKFARFCERCRSENDVYKLAEWLPVADLEAIAA